jgi:hypothetical protein
MRKRQLIALFLCILFLAFAGCEKRESLPTEQDAQKALLHTTVVQINFSRLRDAE